MPKKVEYHLGPKVMHRKGILGDTTKVSVLESDSNMQCVQGQEWNSQNIIRSFSIAILLLW